MRLTFKKEKMSNEFYKHHIRGLPFGAVIHHFTAPDTGGPHDHPFGFTTHIIHGSYIERVYKIHNGNVIVEDIHRQQGTSHYVPSETIHEIIALPHGDCFTLITPGPWERETHFWKFEEGVTLNRHWRQRKYRVVDV